MARPRKKAEELVPDEAPLDELVEAERAVTSETGGEAATEGPAAETPPKAEPRERRARRAKATTKRTATPSGARKPIVRLPKPEHARGRRKERRGVVVSNAMDKTVVVRVETVKPDPRYKKVVRRSSKFHAHDERNEANVGDVVRIVETRPLSKTKSWRVAEVIEAAR
jgi:small subunit ribosomal protein S17